MSDGEERDLLRVLVAPDSFKRSLSAGEAAITLRTGLVSALPSSPIEIHPMADGGEGTAEILRGARGGRWVLLRVTGPRPGSTVDAGWVLLGDGGIAVVEMAVASGLALLGEDARDPGRTTTRGTGELIAHALGRGAETLWLTVGGSATVDGGTGAARALGWRFLDRRGRSLPPGGRALVDLHAIEAPANLDLRPVEVLVDVTNPLCGDRGAARAFGPQKGASPEMVGCLESGLETLARVVEDELGLSIAELPGGGAAGGLAAGAVAFLDAEIVPGVDRVAESTGLPERLETNDYDWIVTGEGRLDGSSLDGKVVDGILRYARRQGIAVAVVTGSVAISEERWRRAGIAHVEATGSKADVPPESREEARRLLREAARRLGTALRRESR